MEMSSIALAFTDGGHVGRVVVFPRHFLQIYKSRANRAIHRTAKS